MNTSSRHLLLNIYDTPPFQIDYITYINFWKNVEFFLFNWGVISLYETNQCIFLYSST